MIKLLKTLTELWPFQTIRGKKKQRWDNFRYNDFKYTF